MKTENKMAENNNDIKKNENIPEDTQTEMQTEENACDKQECTKENDKKEKKSEIKRLRGELEETKKALEEAKTTADEANDKYLRTLAEYDNFRKRTQTERANIYGNAVSDTLSGLLPIIDNLQIAQKYSGGDAEKIAEGVNMILSKLPETLDRLGVKAFGEVGEKFDPNLHNAVMHEDDETKGENEIVDVLQCGYMYGEKVLRYAMVKVAN